MQEKPRFERVAESGLVPEFTAARNVIGLLSGFKDLVLVAQELVRAQSGGRLPKAARLEGISHTAADMLVEAGAVNTRSEGIVLFHDRIAEDKPSLRKLLRQSDIQSGHLKRAKRSKAQRAVATAVKAGQVRRRQDGTLAGLTPAAQRSVKRVKSREAAGRRKKTIERQKRASAQLRGM